MNRLFLLLPLVFVSCVNEDYTRLYYTQPKADNLDWDAIGELQHLGPSVYDDGVNFGLYSGRAERVELLLFDDPESDRPTQQFEMTRYDDVWNLYVEGVGPGQHYGFVAWGPNWTYDPDFYPGSMIGFNADVDVAERQRRARADAGVDLVAVDRGAVDGEVAMHVAQPLVGLQRRLEVEQREARGAAGRALDAAGVVDRAAEHLKAAADADQLAAVAQVARDGRVALPLRLFELRLQLHDTPLRSSKMVLTAASVHRDANLDNSPNRYGLLRR